MTEPRRQPPRSPSRPGPRSVIAISAALLFMQSGAPLYLADAQSAARTRLEIATQTTAALQALAEAVDDIPRSTFDVGAALALAGGTPEAAFAWVRDNIDLVPYTGALRGPVGVLMDGSGNSLDRATLVAALVEAAGGTARLAHGTLEGAALDQVISARQGISAERTTTGATTTADTAAEASRVSAEYGLDPGFVAEAAAAAAAGAAALATDLAQRVDQQTSFLVQAAQGLAVTTTAPTAAYSDHWWAQYQVGGDWVDLDPTLPDAQPGSALVEATEVMPVDAVPAESRHTLRLAVVLECSVEGVLAEHALVMSETLDAAGLLGQRLSVQHIPVALPDDIDPHTDQEAFKELVLGQDLWFPVISLGDQSLYDVQFDADCVRSTATPPFLGTSVAGALDRTTDLLGDLFGPAPEDAVTALFIDYHLHVPGTGDVSIRRPVFDVLGPAARAAGAAEPTSDPAERLEWRLALLGETEILASPGRLSEHYVTDLVSRALLDKSEAIEALVGAGSAAEADAVLQDLADVGGPLPSALYGLASARHSELPPGVFLNGFDIVNRHNQLKVAADGTLRRMQAFDIVANPVASVTGTVADVVRQGVQDTNAETLLTGTLCSAALTSEYCSVTANPADLLALTASDPGAWATLAGGSTVDLAGFGLSADAAALIAADVAAGYTVVVPTAAAANTTASWWRIDPETGMTLGVNELGWGPSMAEYSMIVNFIGFAFCMVGSVGSGASPGSVTLCVFGLATGTGAIVAGAGGIAGTLMIVSALLYGLGGLGIPG